MFPDPPLGLASVGIIFFDHWRDHAIAHCTFVSLLRTAVDQDQSRIGSVVFSRRSHADFDFNQHLRLPMRNIGAAQ
jgi:hypothetical protein